MKRLKLAYVKILLAVFVCSFKLQAQNTDTTSRKDALPYKQNNNQQYLPQYSTKNERTQDSIVENRLVALALMQPKFDEAAAQRKTIDLQLEKQRKAWLNLLSLSMNYNDQTFAGKTNTQTSYVYPKYFFGVTVPLGLIFSGGTDYKITKQSGIIAHDQELELRQTIKANVLSDYTQYRSYAKLLSMQNQANDDAQAYFLQVQQKFSDGTVTLEAYNEASAKYNDGVVKTINLQLQQDLIKIDLERLIGRRLEDIFK
jgi:outer membrane protein TolC